MTKIFFDVAYDMETLEKKQTVELREIWKKVSSPPALRDHIIRDIIRYQKKNRSALSKKYDRRSAGNIECDNKNRPEKMGKAISMPVESPLIKRSVIQWRSQPLITKNRVSRSSLPRKKNAENYQGSQERNRDSRNRSSKPYVKPPLIPDAEGDETNVNYGKIDSQQHRKTSSFNSGFLGWITGGEKMEKKSDEDKKRMSEKVNNDATQMRKKKISQKYSASEKPTRMYGGIKQTSAENFSHLDINLDGLDVIKRKDAPEMYPENSSEFHIRPPSKKVPLSPTERN